MTAGLTDPAGRVFVSYRRTRAAEVVKLLLSKGADVNAQGGRYGNALQAASFAGYKEIVEQLLSNEAEVNAQGGDYGTALQAASSKGYTEVVELLLSKGAEMNAQGKEYSNFS